MATWKDFLQRTLYFHHRIVTSMVLGIGGVLACAVIYLFLFTSAPVEDVQEQGGEIRINKPALERITLWTKKKQADSNITIFVPGTSFVVPPSAP